jgi:alpha-beta hydrolase superfamily lysophospholipase
MRYAQSDYVPQNIQSLRQQLPPFNAGAEADLSANTALCDYLNFYRLPTPNNHIKLLAGHLSDGDQQTHIMAWQLADAVGTAIVVHGYLDHTGLYRNLIGELLQRRMNVVCFDLIGHGLSTGEPGYISSYSDYVRQLNQVIKVASETCPGALHAIGQSTGGAILLKQLIEQVDASNYPFASLNLLAPLVHPKLWTFNRWAFKLTGRFRKTLKRVFRQNSHDPEFLYFLQHLDPFQPRRLPKAWISAMAEWVEEIENHSGSAFPVNLIQGDEDGTLDWQYNLKLLKNKLPNMRLNLIEGAGHHMVNEREDLREKIFAAIKF